MKENMFLCGNDWSSPTVQYVSVSIIQLSQSRPWKENSQEKGIESEHLGTSREKRSSIG